MNHHPEEKKKTDPILSIAWVVIGTLYSAWIAREALGAWSDTSTLARVYYAVAFLAGAGMAVTSLARLAQPPGPFSRLSVILPAVLVANHFGGLFTNVILCRGAG